MKYPSLILILLIVLAFGLGARVQPQMVRSGGGHDSDNVFKVLFGEGRRMFANHFAVKADVYLHSGFYPSIFDQAAKVEEAEAHGEAEPQVPSSEHNHDHGGEAHEGGATNVEGHECDTSFMGAPLDWFEALGRNFMVTAHTHLEGGNAREILPWLELSADLDPQRIETYTVTAYWLSERLGRVAEAELFLRRGLRANPKSYEILFELGKLYYSHLKEPERARNVWLLGLRRWDEVEAGKEKPDRLGRERFLVYLSQLDIDQGNYLEAIRRLQEAKLHSPSPDALEERIQEIRRKFNQPEPIAHPTPH
jgi:tetratricopeptide (TPR) repeat protein